MEEANISNCKNFSEMALKQLGQELKVKEQNFTTKFDDGHCQPISPTVAFDSTNTNLINVARCLPLGAISCPDCNTICQPVNDTDSTGHIILVSLKGRFDIGHITFQCQDCNKQCSSSSPETVFQLCYWPGSIIFDTNLFFL